MRFKIIAAVAAIAAALSVAQPAFAKPHNLTPPPVAVVTQDKADHATSTVGADSQTGKKAPRNGRGGHAPGAALRTGVTTALFPSGYKYAYGQQGFSGTDYVRGVAGNVYIGAPYDDDTSIPADKDHTLFEITAQGGTGNNDIVEVGWAEEPTAFGDKLPRLFASYWKNVGGVRTWGGCYAEGPSCGYVDATPGNSADDLGRDLSSFASAAFPGMVKQFTIQFASGFTCGSDTDAWWVYFNGAATGCFPASLWASGADFRAGKANLVQAFGEVYSGGVFCSDMGNGKAGSSVVTPIDATDPAYVGSLSLVSPSPSTLTPNFTLGNTTAAAYSYGNVGSTGNRTWTWGGAGYTSSGTTPGNIGSC